MPERRAPSHLARPAVAAASCRRSCMAALLIVTLLAGCASQARFLSRARAVAEARDQAEEVARAARSMDPKLTTRRTGDGDILLKIRTGLARRLGRLSRVDSCRTSIASVQFSPGALQVEIAAEIDGIAADGRRVTERWRDRARYRFDIDTGEVALVDWAEILTEETASGVATYRDRTVEAGLVQTAGRPGVSLENRLVSDVWSGCGATAIDYDGDGWTDIFAGDGRRAILYRNDGGRFADRTAEAGLPEMLATGAFTFDYDGDGRADLLTMSNFGPERLFRNTGGRFEEVTEEAGLGRTRKATSAGAADIDGDGDLDLYVLQTGDYGGRLPPMPSRGRNGYPNILYRNEGDGTFTDVTEPAGLESTGWGLACAFGDLDDDGDPDLYVANDFGLNEYFENLGDGTFREATVQAGLGDRGYGMGASLGDYDGDGRLDIYVANIESAYGYIYHDPDLPLPLIGRLFRKRIAREFDGMTRGNTLFRNLGDGRFEETTAAAGVGGGGWAWAASFLDCDNDGRLDIYSPNGFAPGDGPDAELDFWIDSVVHWKEYVGGKRIFQRNGRPLHGWERNRLFRQGPDGAFTDIGFVAGVGDPACARGLVIADFDRDGDLDLYLRNYEARSTYYTYEGPKGHYLQVRLRGDPPNTDGVGARLRLEAGGRRQVREAALGQSYMGGHSTIIHFGLGDAVRIDLLEIRWPDGTIQKVRDIPADRRIEVRKAASDAPYEDGR